MKRLISILLVLLLLSGQPVFVSAAAETSPTPLSGFSYELDPEAKTVTLTKYTGTESTVIVDGSYTVDGVVYSTLLDSGSVFLGNSTITSVVLREGTGLVNNTAAFLFGKCSALTSADLSGLNTAGVTSLRCMFAYCSALESLDLTGLDTACVTDMTGLFSDCVKLSSLTGYENWNTGAVESIYMAFNKTSSLDTIDLSRWDLSHVTNSGWCFQLCNASSILLPDNLKTISAGFMNHAKRYSGTSFALPADVEKIGYAHTFYDFGTGNLVEFTIGAGNSNYKTEGGILYSADGKELLAVPRGKTFPNSVYEIPEGVSFLGELCFSRNHNITTLVLPDSLEIYYVALGDPNYIIKDDDGNLNAGSNLNIAIYSHTGITDYAVKNTNPKYASVDGIVYTKDMTTVVAVPMKYDRHLAIPEGVTTWARDAIWNISDSLASCAGVSIPSTLVDISQDQLDLMNRLSANSDSFTITVDPQNPAYCLDDTGSIAVRTTPPETEPEETLPPVTEPEETEPVQTQPSVTIPPAATEPLPTEPPVTTAPPETQPLPTEPPATAPSEPVDVKPAETVPSEALPSPTVPEQTIPPEITDTIPAETFPIETTPLEPSMPETTEPGSTDPAPNAGALSFGYLFTAPIAAVIVSAVIRAVIRKRQK